MAVIVSRKDVREKVREAIKACADEIVKHGVDALYSEDELVIGGEIYIEIGADISPTITFTRRVLPQVIE